MRTIASRKSIGCRWRMRSSSISASLRLPFSLLCAGSALGIALPVLVVLLSVVLLFAVGICVVTGIWFFRYLRKFCDDICRCLVVWSRGFLERGSQICNAIQRTDRNCSEFRSVCPQKFTSFNPPSPLKSHLSVYHQANAS